MAVTLEQFRSALGNEADGLTDAEIELRLEYTKKFAECFYDWFSKRKGGGVEAISLRYMIDAQQDSERRRDWLVSTLKGVHLLPLPDPDFINEAIIKK